MTRTFILLQFFIFFRCIKHEDKVNNVKELSQHKSSKVVVLLNQPGTAIFRGAGGDATFPNLSGLPYISYSFSAIIFLLC